MDSSLIQALLEFIAAHPILAGLVVFVVAFAESLAIIGLFMPGAVLMFGFGMLIGNGQMDFLATVIWAMLGAIAGDGLSFWLGRHYHQQLKVIWPFRRYPALIARGTDFFNRHGGKSILFGRFVGPVRPIIPAVAGMLDMPWSSFLLVNVFSALLWAPAYLLPGMAFGASLGVAAEVAGRLVIALLLLLALLMISVWLVRRIVYYMQPRTNPLIERSLRLTQNVPYLRAITEALLDPEHPEARVLSGLYVLLLVAIIVFVVLLTISAEGGAGQIDMAVHSLLQGLRTDWMDELMLWLTQFGSLYFILPFSAAMLLMLGYRRDFASAVYLTALIAFSQLSVILLKGLTASPRPGGGFDWAHQYSFPSSHTLMATVLFGFTAVMMAGRLQLAWRWLPYSVAAVLVSLVGFSRLYLGVHWLSDVIAGISLGLVWTALAGIAYRRHHQSHYRAGRLFGVMLASALLALVVYALVAPRPSHLDASQQPPTRHVSQAQWHDTAWQDLPTYRHDLRGFNDHPFNLQLEGDRDSITALLKRDDWQPEQPVGPATALRYLRADSPADELPVPSHVHNADSQDLLYVHPMNDRDRIAVIRLWRSHLQTNQDRWIWYGNISLMRRHQVIGYVQILRTSDEFHDARRLMSDYRDSGHCLERQRQGNQVVLLCSTPRL
ncbi:MAG: VTT domain-containing protein [Gammaproteobacteria bacterium]|nr:VTT domain-containing protein [Gammaproteobacteria bacterium]